MSSVKGRNGGKNRVSAAIHLARGTFRPHRHGSALLAAPAVQTGTPEPSEALLAGLGVEGAAFLRAAYAEYQVSDMEGAVLRLAAQALDDAAAARLASDTKAERAAVRQVLATLQRLGLPLAKVH